MLHQQVSGGASTPAHECISRGTSVALRPGCTANRTRLLPLPFRPPADGFRKQVVALTSSGKVVALHNGDGRLLWSLDFGRAAGLRKLVLWRVPHDVQHDIQVGGCTARCTLVVHIGPPCV